jgi:hypothetical protein
MLEPSKEIWRFIKNNWANWLNVTKTRDRVLLLGTTTLSESFFVGAEEREREREESCIASARTIERSRRARNCCRRKANWRKTRNWSNEGSEVEEKFF